VVFGIVRDYFGALGAEASDKYYQRNARTAYRWVERT
jgi:hypothetical protein